MGRDVTVEDKALWYSPDRRKAAACQTRRRRHARSGRMAYIFGPRSPRQYHPLMPPRALNPIETVWQVMHDNWLSNRVFKNYDGILDHCCLEQSRLTA